MTESLDFQPDWVSSPGETIEDILDERSWTKAEFARRTGFTRKHVNEIVKGRAPITVETAERLSRVLGSTTEFWMVRDAQYRVAIDRKQSFRKAWAEASWLSEIPVAWMRKQQWIGPASDKGAAVVDCLRFFGVATVKAWRERYSAPLVAFRASTTTTMKLGAVAAWLRMAEREAESLRFRSWDESKFRAEFSVLRSLTNLSDPKEFIPDLVSRCADCGVAVVFVPAPPGCPVSGATKWLSPDRALLVLSLRHKANDHLWFSFFHEAGHLLLHGKKLLFVEGIGGLDDKHEQEADAFARDLLIPVHEAKKIADLVKAGPISKATVQSLAARIGIAPGIVVGRMQRESWLPFSHMNDLKIRYQWSVPST
jgi:HTH-type transcriptional regulator/antitoxin HigA